LESAGCQTDREVNYSGEGRPETGNRRRESAANCLSNKAISSASQILRISVNKIKNIIGWRQSHTAMREGVFVNTNNLVLFSPSGNIQKKSKGTKTDLANTWNLEDIYPSDDVWMKAKNELQGKMDDILKFKGKLSESASLLSEYLDMTSTLSQK